MQRVINHSLQSEMLESGQVLAAAGTPGSVREDVTLSALDRARLVETGRVAVVKVKDEAAPAERVPDEDASDESVPKPRRPRANTERLPAATS